MPIPAASDYLAAYADVEDRLGRALLEEEYARTDALLYDAAALVNGFCRRVFTSPAPDAVLGVVAQIVARALTVPVTAFRTEDGPLAFTGGPYLSSADKQALLPYRRGVRSVPMTTI